MPTSRSTTAVTPEASELRLIAPDDWHVHLRDGDALQRSVADTAHYFCRALIMPNLDPPVTTTKQALAYRERILQALPSQMQFEPRMTLFLHPAMEPAEIRRAVDSGAVQAGKFYPSGATTGSRPGAAELRSLYRVFEAMQKFGLPLCVHGESVSEDIDIFDRERVFLERELAPLLEDFSALKIVLEHISTRESVEFVRAARPGVAATITAHHLLCNRNHMLEGGLRPHNYCMPILKREEHRQALIHAASSGEKRFFLGSDSAPHALQQKESACGCAGCYTAPAALPLYAKAFAAAGALEQLEAFAAFHGADFYGLPRNRKQLTLEYKAWQVPQSLVYGSQTIRPFAAGEILEWQ